MIYDRLDRADMYRPLGPRIAQAIDFAREHADLPALPPGRIDVDGEDVFAVVHAYQTKPAGEARWEAHRRYIDLQLVLAGVERMDVADVGGLAGLAPFDAERDVAFYAPPDSFQSLHVPAGAFAIFLPHDAHRPSVAIGAPAAVRKIVFKILVD